MEAGDDVCSETVISIEASSAQSSEHLPRPRLGNYEIVKSIGSGGMAEVFLARNLGPMGFEKYVVLKCVHPHLAREKQFVTMFLDEARIAARINDPRVVQIYELGETGGTYFMAMEYLAGESLGAVVKHGLAGGLAMPPHLVARVIADVALGLHAAHELRDTNGRLLDVVHRDVSHANVYVLYSGAVKVLDFGVAKARDSLQQTSAGERKGTFGYMSPEQVNGVTIDRRSDVFSLGVVLWECLTRMRLFSARTERETMRRVLEGQPPPPSSFEPSVPAALDAIVAKALHKDRRQRFPTAEDFALALETYLRNSGLPTGMSEVAAYMKSAFGERIVERAKVVRATAAIEPLQQPPIAALDYTPTPEQIELVELRASRRRMRGLFGGFAAAVALAAALYIGHQRPPAHAEAVVKMEETPPPALADRSLVDATLERATTAIEAGRFAAPPGDNALELLLDIERQDPGNARALELRARAVDLLVANAGKLWNANRRDSARSLYADVLLFDPVHALAKQRAKRSRTGKSVALTPDEIAWIITEIDLAIIERRLIAPPGRNALEYLQKLRALAPDHEAARRLGGEVATALASEAKTNASDAPKLLAAVGVANGSQPVVAVAPAAEVERPRDAQAARRWIELGNGRLAVGQLAEARKAFERALAADFGSHAAMAGLAETSYNESDFTRAVLAAKRAIAIAPRIGAYRMVLGKSYYKLMRYDDAIAQWQKAHELDRRNTAAQKNIEMARRRMGQ